MSKCKKDRPFGTLNYACLKHNLIAFGANRKFIFRNYGRNFLKISEIVRSKFFFLLT